ncbi:MAG: acyl-CoA dehydrogenase family protein [Acidimicrobiales bacterium]
MDLSPNPRYEAFREECRSWLAANRPARPLRSMDTAVGFEEHREWERVLFDGGWSVPAWPAAYGGRDCDLIEWLIYEEEYWLSGVPGRVSANGVSLLAPTIFNFGTQEQQDYFLPRMASGEHVWAQGWSEPEAGSDLAGIKTKAIREGDHYVLNGQKTWCSRGAFADWIFCIVRTDPDAERHAGLTYLLVPADAPGLERRPIGRLDGEPGFAELFFDDCRVSVDHVLGAEGQGWAVAMAAAGSERGLSLRSPGRFMAAAERLTALRPRDGGQRVGDRSAAARRGDRCLDPGPGVPLADVPDRGPADGRCRDRFGGQPHEGVLVRDGSRAPRHGATAARRPRRDRGGQRLARRLRVRPVRADLPGTNEIQRNIIAERVLGLPRR